MCTCLTDHTITPSLAALPVICNRSTRQDSLRHYLQQGAGLLEPALRGRSDVGLALLDHADVSQLQYYCLWVWPWYCTESSIHSSAEISRINQYHKKRVLLPKLQTRSGPLEQGPFQEPSPLEIDDVLARHNTSEAHHHANVGPGIPQSLHPCFDR